MLDQNRRQNRKSAEYWGEEQERFQSANKEVAEELLMSLNGIRRRVDRPLILNKRDQTMVGILEKIIQVKDIPRYLI